MKLLSYDIEIWDELPSDGNVNLKNIIPSVAAIGTCKDDVEFFDDEPSFMSKETAKKLVDKIMTKYEEGYIPFGHNTLSFDFQLLAHYSGEYEKCGELALNGIDSMFLVVANRGYFLGLDSALKGFGLETKKHTVTL